MTQRVLPKLSQRTIEDIVVAITRATNERGLRVSLLPEDVLLPEVLEQFPKTIWPLGCTR